LKWDIPIETPVGYSWIFRFCPLIPQVVRGSLAVKTIKRLKHQEIEELNQFPLPSIPAKCVQAFQAKLYQEFPYFLLANVPLITIII
jgi:hypothetical protein